MGQTNAEARAQILDELAVAIDEIALALALLSEAYEQVDLDTQDRLESELFRPVQRAFGRAKRTRIEFAARHGLAAGSSEAGTPSVSSKDARTQISEAIESSGQASHMIAELQDSMLPAEFGDAQLRAGLAEVRGLLDGLPLRTRELLRSLGR